MFGERYFREFRKFILYKLVRDVVGGGADMSSSSSQSYKYMYMYGLGPVDATSPTIIQRE